MNTHFIEDESIKKYGLLGALLIDDISYKYITMGGYNAGFGEIKKSQKDNKYYIGEVFDKDLIEATYPSFDSNEIIDEFNRLEKEGHIIIEQTSDKNTFFVSIKDLLTISKKEADKLILEKKQIFTNIKE